MIYDCKVLCAELPEYLARSKSVRTVLLVADDGVPMDDTYDHLPDMTVLTFSQFRQCYGALHSLKTVLTPLVASEFDAYEVCALLSGRDFKGEIRAFGWSNARISQISDEISQTFPSLHFAIISRDKFGRINLS